MRTLYISFLGLVFAVAAYAKANNVPTRPIFASTAIANFDTIPGVPPPPPPPPIQKKYLINANKMAADFAANSSAAEKKYKVHRGMVTIQGIVKEIKPADEFYMTVILDGAPSKFDLQFDQVSARKTKNLSKGMKALFLAQYYGVKGTTISFGGIYIEKPTFE